MTWEKLRRWVLIHASFGSARPASFLNTQRLWPTLPMIHEKASIWQVSLVKSYHAKNGVFGERGLGFPSQPADSRTRWGLIDRWMDGLARLQGRKGGINQSGRMVLLLLVQRAWHSFYLFWPQNSFPFCLLAFKMSFGPEMLVFLVFTYDSIPAWYAVFNMTFSLSFLSRDSASLKK